MSDEQRPLYPVVDEPWQRHPLLCYLVRRGSVDVAHLRADFAQVEEWFRKTGHRPPADKIWTILEKMIDLAFAPPVPPLTEVVEKRRQKLAKAVHDIRAEIAAELKYGADPTDPADTRLIDLVNAAVLAEPFIGWPPRQGPPKPYWHAVVTVLQEPIAEALRAAGRRRVGITAEGPLVCILAKSIAALPGSDKTLNEDRIARYLKEQKRRS